MVAAGLSQGEHLLAAYPAPPRYGDELLQGYLFGLQSARDAGPEILEERIANLDERLDLRNGPFALGALPRLFRDGELLALRQARALWDDETVG